jgi:hypothetical protein
LRRREGKAVSAAVQGLVDVVTRAMADGEADRRTDGQAEEERRLALAEGFRRRVEAGEYGALLDGRMREVLAQAAARDGLEEEMGAARFVLMRLLVEEEDLGKQALGVSRIITAAARVARARKAIGPGEEDTLTAFINERLREIEEVDAERRREVELGRLPEAAYLEVRRGFVEGGWLPELPGKLEATLGPGDEVDGEGAEVWEVEGGEGSG